MARIHAPLVKILVAGASQVGKTSLVHKYVFKDFIDVSPTIGVNFAQKIVYGEEGPLNLSIWDLSGEDRFRFLMPQFCSGASAVILVFDQTRPNSLAEGTSWLNLLQRYAHPSHRHAIILAGNKADLSSCVSRQEIQSFCKTHEIAGFVSCSAKTDTRVDLVFETLCTTIQQNLPEPTDALTRYLRAT
ncbi:MAG: Rab family GTPase [Candidatus Hermodarchaeota archaeon]|nr:Rab family GTPase [Candidatus Hermodarchaeota archaeon]